jgi:Uri superfamily endonuclease
MEMRKAPGTYALLLHCPREARVSVGKLGELSVANGCYVYIGSAFGPGGVRARCLRHWRGAERLHWHIDYLRQVCVMQEIWFTHDAQRREHQWAALMAATRGSRSPFSGFGASDCACETHLFHFPAQAPKFGGFQRRVRRQISAHARIGCYSE